MDGLRRECDYHSGSALYMGITGILTFKECFLATTLEKYKSEYISHAWNDAVDFEEEWKPMNFPSLYLA